MAVYVDDLFAPYGSMVMCHMIADTPQELREMADKIKVSRKYLQYSGTYKEHLDVSKGKRALAVQFGAIEITLRDMAKKIKERKEQQRQLYKS